MAIERVGEGERIVFYDGQCPLCSSLVSFLVARDSGDMLRYAPLSGYTARRYLPSHRPDSLHFFMDGALLVKSDAVIQITTYLPYPWRALRWLTCFPRPLRDWCYDLCARLRPTSTLRCDVRMSPEKRSKFLP